MSHTHYICSTISALGKLCSLHDKSVWGLKNHLFGCVHMLCKSSLYKSGYQIKAMDSWICTKETIGLMDDNGSLVQERHNSSALAFELCLFCTNPSIFYFIITKKSQWKASKNASLGHQWVYARYDQPHLSFALMHHTMLEASQEQHKHLYYYTKVTDAIMLYVKTPRVSLKSLVITSKINNTDVWLTVLSPVAL